MPGMRDLVSVFIHVPSNGETDDHQIQRIPLGLARCCEEGSREAQRSRMGWGWGVVLIQTVERGGRCEQT